MSVPAHSFPEEIFLPTNDEVVSAARTDIQVAGSVQQSHVREIMVLTCLALLSLAIVAYAWPSSSPVPAPAIAMLEADAGVDRAPMPATEAPTPADAILPPAADAAPAAAEPPAVLMTPNGPVPLSAAPTDEPAALPSAVVADATPPSAEADSPIASSTELTLPVQPAIPAPAAQQAPVPAAIDATPGWPQGLRHVLVTYPSGDTAVAQAARAMAAQPSTGDGPTVSVETRPSSRARGVLYFHGEDAAAAQAVARQLGGQARPAARTSDPGVGTIEVALPLRRR